MAFLVRRVSYRYKTIIYIYIDIDILAIDDWTKYVIGTPWIISKEACLSRNCL